MTEGGFYAYPPIRMIPEGHPLVPDPVIADRHKRPGGLPSDPDVPRAMDVHHQQVHVLHDAPDLQQKSDVFGAKRLMPDPLA